MLFVAMLRFGCLFRRFIRAYVDIFHDLIVFFFDYLRQPGCLVLIFQVLAFTSMLAILLRLPLFRSRRRLLLRYFQSHYFDCIYSHGLHLII